MVNILGNPNEDLAKRLDAVKTAFKEEETLAGMKSLLEQATKSSKFD